MQCLLMWKSLTAAHLEGHVINMLNTIHSSSRNTICLTETDVNTFEWLI